MSLTLRQKQILEFIGRFIEKRGYGPSLMEIGAEFGLSSPATVHKHLQALEREGLLRRVHGGALAAVARDVDGRTRKDARVKEAEAALKAAASDAERVARRAAFAEITRTVRSEKLGEVADEFDRIHSVHRALEVGSLDRIISAAELRPYLIDAIERGMAREMERWRTCTPPSQ